MSKIAVFLMLACFASAVMSWRYTTCKTLQKRHPKLSSGVYYIRLPSGYHRAYCEMGINGGGYTFISFATLQKLRRNDLKVLVKNRRDVLMRISKPDGTQPYTVIKQMTNTGGLSIQLSSYRGHTKPMNTHLGAYLFIGTLPAANARNHNHQGFISNNRRVSFRNCDRNPNNFFAFFANPKEKPVSRYHSNLVYERTGMCVNFRGTAKRPPSGRRMPLDYFLFTEMHYGGCGCYTDSQRWLKAIHPALGTAIGLR